MQDDKCQPNIETSKLLIPVPEDLEKSEIPYKNLWFFYRAEKYFSTILETGLVVASLALALVMFAQVFLRYVIKLPFLGIEEMAPLFAVWSYFLGMTLATRKRIHIGGGILTLVFTSPFLIKTVRLFGTVACLFVVLLFGYYALQMANFNMSLGRLSIYMRLPKYLWDFSVVFGCFLSGLYFIVQMVLEMIDLFHEANSGRRSIK